MPIYSGSQKLKELYVGSQKIKEAHVWNGTAFQKVYSSAPDPQGMQKNGSSQTIGTSYSQVDGWENISGWAGTITSNALVVPAATYNISCQIDWSFVTGFARYVRIMVNGSEVGSSNGTGTTLTHTQNGVSIAAGAAVTVQVRVSSTTGGTAYRTVAAGSSTFLKLTPAT